MVYLINVYWSDGYCVSLQCKKWPSIAELRFLVHCAIKDMRIPKPYDSENFCRADIAIPPDRQL